MNNHLLGESRVKVTIKAPTVYPVIVPTKMSLHTFNFYLVETAGKLLLIDAGVESDKCWNIFQDVLAAHDYSVEDIDAIILTHHHEDHIGLVNRIRTIKDIPLYAHEKGFNRLQRDPIFLEKRIELYAETFQEMGCGKEAEIEIFRMKKARIENESQTIHGEILPLRGGDNLFGFQVIETPGHALDHIMLYHEPSQAAFIGDQFIEHSSTNALIDLDGDGSRTLSLLIYEASLRHLLTIPMSIAYAGHGNIMENPHEVITKHLQRIERKSNKVVQLLAEEKTVAKLAREMYGDKYETLFSLVMSDVIGHIDRLEQTGNISKTYRDGVFYYQQKQEESH